MKKKIKAESILSDITSDNKSKKRHNPLTIAPDRVIARAGSIKRVPLDEVTQNAMIDEMYAWVKSDDAIFELEHWAHMKNINPYRFYRCANNNEYFADVLEAIHSYVAKRYKRAMRKREIDTSYGLKMLYEHDPNYRESCMSKIKADKESRAAAILAVQMQQFEPSVLVPEKPKDPEQLEVRDVISTNSLKKECND